ncbi:MAG TPA: ABC transporter permease [Chthoniobacterales bacterium]|nr:ABC transporter permease [Chthoniobacterales bacterium]
MIIAYLKSLRARFLRRAETEHELEQELQSHIEMRTNDLIRAGWDSTAARRQARIEFGSHEKFKEECRETIAGNFLDVLIQDVRFSLRMLRKSPGFTAIAVLTVALGVGATTAIFSVVDATLLQPLPYSQPEQLVSIQSDLPAIGAHDIGISQPELQDFQRSGIFEYVSPMWFDENNLTGLSQPTRVRLTTVAANYFALLRVQPQLGRGFDPQYNSPGFIPEIVISDSLWKRLFGGDPNILDKSVRMDTDLYRIIGVMPPGFDSPGRTAEERNVEVWASTSFYGPPLPDHPARNRRNLPTTIARLSPGLTISAAQSRLDALAASLQKQFPGDYPNDWKIRLRPLKETVVGNFRQPLLLLLGAVGLVLLIGCVNVANLLLARASARSREMAIRRALGAGQARLTRQLLTESSILSILGGIAGVGILVVATEPLLQLVPENLPRLNNFSISWSVLTFAVGMSILSGLIFGLAPALYARRLDLIQALNQEGRSSAGSGERTRARRALVVTEFALSLVLMISAGLLLHSFWDLLNVPLGFNPQSVMSVRTRLPYPNDTSIDKYATAAQEAPFIRELLRRCGSLPGVEEVAIGDPASIPLDESQRRLNALEGKFFLTFDGKDPNAPSMVERSRITPEYFHLAGIPLRRGRLFNEFDNDTAPQVAVVNEAFARIYWPNKDAIGKRFKSTRPDSPWITVVGIIANARTQSLADNDAPQLYLNIFQVPAKHLAIFLRGRIDTASIPDRVRAQVQALDPTLPVFGAQALTQTVSDSLAQRRFSMEMIAAFAVTALLLAAIGIYGVISFMVTERTQEIGIRLALGAQRQNILGIVLGQGLRLALTGAGVGLICAIGVSQLMTTLLYGVKPIDPLTFVGVAFLFLGVAVLACYLPARRAMKVDPMVALRCE